MARDERNMTSAVCVLLAQEDAQRRAMTEDALLEGRVAVSLHFAGSADEVRERVALAPQPQLVLLDHAMARAEDALAALKDDRRSRRIPVVVLGGQDPEIAAVARWYELGAAAYVAEPVTFLDLVETMKSLSNWWLDTVALPPAA
jgi:CheY-like chemotaxis protein